MRTFLVAALHVALLTGTVVSASIFAVQEVSRSQSRFDPFAPYMDMMPGQPGDAVMARGFTCQSYSAPYNSHEEYCTFEPDAGEFSRIEVDISSSTGMIARITFRPRPTAVTIGSLVLLWGQPEVNHFGQKSSLQWHDQQIVAFPQHDHPHFPYLYSIDYVAFESAG